MKKIIFIFILNTIAFASSPIHWGIGVNWANPVGSSRSGSAYSAGEKAGVGLDLEFGQRLNSKFGYRVGLHTMGFPTYRFNDLNPKIENQPALRFVDFGLDYLVSQEHHIELYGNISLAHYKNIHSRESQITLGDGSVINTFASVYQEQSSALGFETGLRKRVVGGLWCQVAYHHTNLNKDKVGADSIKWVGVGLKYIWGQ